VIDARIASDATAPTPGAPWWNQNVRMWLADQEEEKQEILNNLGMHGKVTLGVL